LIIQEKNNKPNIPDDNKDGGKIIIKWPRPAPRVYKMGLLDMDYSSNVIVEYHIPNVVHYAKKNLKVPLLGDNSFQDFAIQLGYVHEITLDMQRSGAITYIEYCYNPFA
jgi:hypothetical protein